MYTDPVQLFDFAKLPEKLRQHPLSVKVGSVAAGILCDNDQLLHAVLRERPRLVETILHCAAPVFPAQGGNHTISAMIIAALRNFKKRIILRCGQNTADLVHGRVDIAELGNRFAGKQLFRRPHDIRVAARAENTVHLRQLLQNLLLIALGKAARHQDFPDDSLLLQRAHRQNIVDGLTFRGIDESAGVDDNKIRALHRGQNLITGLL